MIVYDNAGTHHDIAALVNGTVHTVAEKIKARAEGLATAHVETGAYANSFGVEADGDLDYIVYNDDPAAVSIEYGHTTKAGMHVAGQFILTRSV